MQSHTTSLSRAAVYAAAAVLCGYALVAQQPPGDALLRGFQNPPDSARPRVWWHWMSGNVTKEGIKADLARMALLDPEKRAKFSTSDELAGMKERLRGALDADADRRIGVLKTKRT